MLVAALAENSKPFRPFLVMVENVRIDCIRDLPVTLNSFAFVAPPPFLPLLTAGLGFVVLMLHCFSSTATTSPTLLLQKYYRNSVNTEGEGHLCFISDNKSDSNNKTV